MKGLSVDSLRKTQGSKPMFMAGDREPWHLGRIAPQFCIICRKKTSQIDRKMT